MPIVAKTSVATNMEPSVCALDLGNSSAHTEGAYFWLSLEFTDWSVCTLMVTLVYLQVLQIEETMFNKIKCTHTLRV